MIGRVLEKEKVLRGEDLPQSKATEDIVRAIRRLHARKEALKRRLDAKYSLEALGDRFGLHKNSVGKIVCYETWRHVADDDATRRLLRAVR